MAGMVDHKWTIHVPCSEMTGQPVLIGPFDTEEEAQRYVAQSQTDKYCTYLPILPPHDDASTDAVF